MKKSGAYKGKEYSKLLQVGKVRTKRNRVPTKNAWDVPNEKVLSPTSKKNEKILKKVNEKGRLQGNMMKKIEKPYSTLQKPKDVEVTKNDNEEIDAKKFENLFQEKQIMEKEGNIGQGFHQQFPFQQAMYPGMHPGMYQMMQPMMQPMMQSMIKSRMQSPAMQSGIQQGIPVVQNNVIYEKKGSKQIFGQENIQYLLGGDVVIKCEKCHHKQVVSLNYNEHKEKYGY